MRKKPPFDGENQRAVFLCVFCGLGIFVGRSKEFVGEGGAAGVDYCDQFPEGFDTQGAVVADYLKAVGTEEGVAAGFAEAVV